MSHTEKSPVITVGRYAGTPIDQLPNSYLRWMLTQNFPKIWLEAAEKKLMQSDYNDLHLHVSRHALDMFSKRFIHIWTKNEARKGDDCMGIASYVAWLANEAWEKGEDISKRRHQDDGIVRELNGIRFVFVVNPNFPEYKSVITVM